MKQFYKVLLVFLIVVQHSVMNAQPWSGWYTIENKFHTPARLQNDGTSVPKIVTVSDESDATKWQMKDAPNGAYYIENTDGSRLSDGNGSDDPSLVAASTTGARVEWNIIESSTSNQYWITSNASHAQPRIRTDGSGIPDMAGTSSSGNFTRWELVSTSAPAGGGGATVAVDDKDAGWTWSGWPQYNDAACFGGSGHGDFGSGKSGEYTFDGSSVKYYAWKGSDGGTVKVSIDNVSRGTFSLQNGTDAYQQLIFSTSGLSAGNHTIKIESVNNSGSEWAMVDYIEYTTHGDGGSCVIVDTDNFESGWGIWNDGGTDARRNSSDAAFANGSYCIRLVDNTSTSVMSTNNLDLTSFTSVDVSFSYYCSSMDNSNEDFWLQVSTDGGSNYTTVEEWNFGDEFVNDQRYNEQVTISEVSFTSNTRLRFRCDASGNSDYVYIDDVYIEGCGGCSTAVPNVIGMVQSAAQSAITSAGLTVGSVNSQYDETVGAGLVLSQSIADGQSVNCNSAVDIVTSLGPNPNSSGDYYIDADNGNDNNEGTQSNPWKTLAKVSSLTFQPGSNIYFKRGTSYTGCVTIHGDGAASSPITIGAYGTGSAPSFTNPNYSTKKGNAMRIRGDYQIVENLYFHHTAPAPAGDIPYQTVWDVGALHVSLGNDHVVIRNNEFANNAKAIQSYSEFSLITNNYIHDANTTQQNGFLSDPEWGPIAIHLGIGNQELSYNTIENMYAEGGAFGSDGGAIELDDGRNHKDNFHIHHNTTYHNLGFLEVSYWADTAFRASDNVLVEYNVSRDYQSFLLWWAPTTNSAVQNNTIIRDDNAVEGPWKGVFIHDATPGDINLTKNIIVVDNDQSEKVFIEGYDGAVDDITHTNNCYWNVDGGNVQLGQSLGSGEIKANPLFVNYASGDYNLQAGSPAAGWGALGSSGARILDTTVTSNEEKPQSQEWAIYPNPSAGMIDVACNQVDCEGIVRLKDFAGRELDEFKINGQLKNLDLTKFPPGIYFVQYGAITKKLILR